MSVHTQELIRRMVNTSEKIEWNVNMAPVLTNYMEIMLQAGNGQSYRRRVLEPMSWYMSRKTRAFITTHQDDMHSIMPTDLKVRAVESFKDCLSRKVSEGIHIRKGGPELQR